jgi:hypothetical protein
VATEITVEVAERNMRDLIRALGSREEADG